ncbi:MAG TPA: TonB-dependent receptor [Rhodothermales bacterium]|nr:TonB-dependent receptor [Rhodothermales bacterium]
MKSTYAFALLFTFALASPVAAQIQGGQRPGGSAGGFAGGRITGTVIDAKDNSPIPSATVAVWGVRDSSLVTGALSDEEGSFAVEGIRPGRYYVRISSLGYETQTISDVTLRAPSAMAVKLGTVKLASDTQVLSEVQVTGERPMVTMEVDRTVYNTENQIVSSGGAATDVLQNIPSVDVDVDGNISLRGNQNVAVLINGRPAPVHGDALASFLQSIPASSVERIEVMPNPSAAYDPDGMAGILNIVLKKQDDRGINGTLTASAGTRESYRAGGNVNYRRGPLNLFANYSFRYGERDRSGTMFRTNLFLDPLTYLDQYDEGSGTRYGHTVNLTADYELSERNTISASGLLSTRPSNGLQFTDYTTLNAARDPIGRFRRSSTEDESGLNMDYKLGFRHVVEPSKNQLTAELRFDREIEDETSHFENDSLTASGEKIGDFLARQNNVTGEQTNEGALQVDYVRPLGNGKLEAGYKGTLRQLDNDFFSESFDAAADAYLPDDSLNNSFKYNEQVHAAYAQAQQRLGKFDLQVGVRAEQALTNFNLLTTQEAYDNNYFSLFPSAFLTYRLTETRAFKISYSKRINRPRTWSLNPFPHYDDPLNLRRGNPYLKPEYVHSFEAGFTQFTKNTSLSATPYFRHTVNETRRWVTIDDQGVTTMTFQNFDQSNRWGFELIGTLQKRGLFNGYVSFNAYQVVTSGSTVASNYSNSAIGWDARANASFTLTPTLDMQLSYFYRAPMKTEQGRIYSFQRANIALRQKLFGNRASLTLRVSDPFNTMGFHMIQDDPRFHSVMDRNFNARNAYLSFTYNFGTQQQQRNRERDQDQGPDQQGDMDPRDMP